MEQFAYVLRPTRPQMLAQGATSQEEKIVKRHFQYLEDLTSRAVVLFAGRTLTTDERSFGIVVLEAEDEALARGIMEGDPAVKQGVMSAELFPYRVALIRGS